MITVYNSSLYPGWSGILLYINSINSLFVPGVLFMIFVITFVTSLIYQQRTMNLTNPSAAFVFAGFLDLASGLILSLIPGLIMSSYLIVIIALLVVGFIWLIYSGN